MHAETTITIQVTPKMLRDIAMDLDRRMKKAMVGEHCPSHEFYGEGYVIKLIADQDAFHKQDKNLWA